MTCPDRPGLVAEVSGFLSGRGANIVHADQHTDRQAGTFLQRVEFEPPGPLDRDELARAFAAVADAHGMQWTLGFSDEPRRVAILVSRLGHCLCDLLSRWRMGEFPAEVRVVISNHEDLRPVAAELGIPYHHLPVDPANRRQQEAAICDVLEREQIDLVVLARYMQVLGDAFVERFRHRTLNIHHSFLPAFAGARPYHRAHGRGVKIIGATAHYVTAELDEGPIVAQDVAHVSHRDSVSDMMRKGRDLERVVLARALDLHLRGRVIVYGNKTAVFD